LKVAGIKKDVLSTCEEFFRIFPFGGEYMYEKQLRARACFFGDLEGIEE